MCAAKKNSLDRNDCLSSSMTTKSKDVSAGYGTIFTSPSLPLSSLSPPAAAQLNSDPAGDPSSSSANRPPPTSGGASGLVLAASLVAATGGLLFGYDVGVISVAQLPLQRHFGLSCTAREAVVSCMMAGALLASMIGGEYSHTAARRALRSLCHGLFVGFGGGRWNGTELHVWQVDGLVNNGCLTTVT